MRVLKFLFYGVLSTGVSHLIPRALLFRKKTSDTIYFAYINPREIVKTSLVSESSKHFNGVSGVYGTCKGWWNLLYYPIKDNIMFQYCNEVLDGKESRIYRYISRRHSKKAADDIRNKLLELHESLKEEGYLSQYEMERLDRTIELGGYVLPKNETFVALNKKGEFIRLFSGRHRLAIAQHLNIKEIPVLITLLHPDAERYLPKKRRKVTGSPLDFKPFD